MNFHSLTTPSLRRSFSAAVIEGLAPDRGLYFPDSIPQLDEASWLEDPHGECWSIASKIIHSFSSEELEMSELKELMKDVLNFPIELIELEGGLYVLELFHGPTAAFKDVGARTMSRLLGRFSEQRLTVLVATSGDTGSAVAQGFLNVSGVDVVILYPSGRISEIQEKQLTTAGFNVTALEVKGNFDDCQRMVKEAFLDSELRNRRALTSANSINVARWIPQASYYAWATFLLGEGAHFVVPSGNLGNLAAGVLAHRMGMPARGFTAASNANDVVPELLTTGVYAPRPTVATLSNAMDVGDPSNLPRLRELFGGSTPALQDGIAGFKANDAATREAMKRIHDQFGYLACPHTAIGIAAAQKRLALGGPVVALATAHPAKFGSVVEDATGIAPEIPESLKGCVEKEKVSVLVEPTLEALRAYLLDTAQA
jgi:threonine synthase